MGAIFSAAANWYTDSRFIIQGKVNYIVTANSIDTFSATIGLGYQLDKPATPGPLTGPSPAPVQDLKNEVTFFAGRTVTNAGKTMPRERRASSTGVILRPISIGRSDGLTNTTPFRAPAPPPRSGPAGHSSMTVSGWRSAWVPISPTTTTGRTTLPRWNGWHRYRAVSGSPNTGCSAAPGTGLPPPMTATRMYSWRGSGIGFRLRVFLDSTGSICGRQGTLIICFGNAKYIQGGQNMRRTTDWDLFLLSRSRLSGMFCDCMECSTDRGKRELQERSARKTEGPGQEDR